MAFQTFENDKNNRGQIKRKNLKNEIRSAWLHCTLKFEPILSKMAEAQPHRLVGKSARRAPPEKPFAYFLRFPRRDFLDLEKEKGFSVGLPALKRRGGRGFAEQ